MNKWKSSVVLSILVAILLVGCASKEADKDNGADAAQGIGLEEEEGEILTLDLSDEEKELLAKPVSELGYDELEKISELIKYNESYTDEDQGLILANKDEVMAKYQEEKEIKEAKDEEERVAREEKERIEREERKAKEEKNRIAKEKQDEIDRIAREKEAEVERIAEEKAEKEKYNTGITWDDMARDKDGLPYHP